jgi:hypothetical protein
MESDYPGASGLGAEPGICNQSGEGQLAKAAMSPAASGGRTVEPVTEEDFRCAA